MVCAVETKWNGNRVTNLPDPNGKSRNLLVELQVSQSIEENQNDNVLGAISCKKNRSNESSRDQRQTIQKLTILTNAMAISIFCSSSPVPSAPSNSYVVDCIISLSVVVTVENIPPTASEAAKILLWFNASFSCDGC